MNTTSRFFMAVALVLLAAAIIVPAVNTDNAAFNEITPAAGSSTGLSVDSLENFNEAFPPVPTNDLIKVPARLGDEAAEAVETIEEAASDAVTGIEEMAEDVATDAWGTDLQDIEPAAGGSSGDFTPEALK